MDDMLIELEVPTGWRRLLRLQHPLWLRLRSRIVDMPGRIAFWLELRSSNFLYRLESGLGRKRGIRFMEQEGKISIVFMSAVIMPAQDGSEAFDPDKIRVETREAEVFAAEAYFRIRQEVLLDELTSLSKWYLLRLMGRKLSSLARMHREQNAFL